MTRREIGPFSDPDDGAGTIHVLLVDDDPSLLELTATFLERESDRLAVDTATDAHAGLEALDAESYDCVVSDYDMPGTDGLEFLERIRARYSDVPFVLFTGKGSEEIASEAISAGVTDYIQKGGTEQYSVLANRVENAAEGSRAKHALAEGRRRLATLVDNLPGIVYRTAVDAPWSVEFVGGRVEEVMGRPRSAFERGDVTFGDLVHDDDIEDLRTAVREGVETGESFEVTYRIRTPDGEIRHLWEQGAPVLERGEPVALEGYIVDVTRRKEYERRLDVLHETTRELMRAESRGAIAEITTDAARDVLGLEVNTVYVHEEGENALVPATETPEGRELFDEFPTFTEGEALAWKVYEMGEPRVYDDVSAEPEAYNPETPIRSEAIFPLGDHGVFIVGSTDPGEFDERTTTLAGVLAANVQEALDRVRQHRRLRERERKIQRLHDGIQDLIGARTKDDVAEIAVEIARDTLGYPFSGVHLVDEARRTLEPVAVADRLCDQLGTAPTYERTDPSRTVDEVVWDAFERNETILVEDVREHGTIVASETPIRSGIVHPLDDHGVFIASSVEPTDFDETDRALAAILANSVAAALDQVEREVYLRGRKRSLESENERLDRFTSVVSHDLRNPLNLAGGRLELARSECDSEHLAEVAYALDRMDALIDDLLALAREGRVVDDFEPFRLEELVRRCWNSVETADAELRVDAAVTVRADRNRLAQVFENAFRNAVEHAGENAAVTVGTFEDGFYVEDDGPGIPPDERRRAFDAGYSTTETGTGFGLSIVREVVEAHGWTVEATEGDAGGVRLEVAGVEFAD